MSENTNFCKECNKNFAKSSNLRAHAIKFHPDKLQDIAPKKIYNVATTCKKCSKTFSQHYNFVKHVQKYHSGEEADVLAERNLPPHFTCDICKKTFIHLSHFKNHKREHSTGTSVSASMNKCPLCTYEDPLKLNLKNHFELTHNLPVRSEALSFSTFEEFTQWKSDLEKATKVTFINKLGTRYNLNQSKKIKYECHRSGIYKPTGKGVRCLKSQGTCKINGYCPAEIKVTVYESGLSEVIWTETHVGHDYDLGHLRLTSSEKMQIASKIASKIPFSAVLDDIRDSVTNCELERLHLLTRKDLYNIEYSFNLNNHSTRHKNDAISIEAWIIEMESTGCVLYYKGQDRLCDKYPYLKPEDFILIIMTDGQLEILQQYGTDSICIDSTHGMNAYDFQLSTLLVLDDIREGFPCSYLISSRTDEPTMFIFFSEIKEKLGSAFGPKVFMSDMASTFYNAWIKVMYPATYRLFCTWHVDRAWRHNLNKIDSKEEKALVYKQLRTLLQERDENAFVVLLNNFITSLFTKESTIEFGKYFKAHYLNNCESWAYCYRINAGLNTNMHIERMHRTIKYLYLGGKHVKRLDKAVSAIMKFTKDKLFERLIVLNKGKISSKITHIRLRHRSSEILDLSIVREMETGWQVASSSSNDIYIVEERNLSCNCKLVCQDCQTCLHRYSCTCLDASIRWNMCKHIHLVCKFRKNTDKPNEKEERNTNSVLVIDESNNEKKQEEQKILKAVSTNKRKVTSEEMVTREIEQLNFTFMQATANIVFMEEVEAAKKLVSSLQPTFIAIKNKLHNTNVLLPSEAIASTSTSKNIKPQRRLYKTKKNKKTAEKNKGLRLAKPNNSEIEKLALTLLHPDEITDINIGNFEEVEAVESWDL